jgi:hypothetical protein
MVSRIELRMSRCGGTSEVSASAYAGGIQGLALTMMTLQGGMLMFFRWNCTGSVLWSRQIVCLRLRCLARLTRFGDVVLGIEPKNTQSSL